MFAASKSGSVDAKDPQFNYVTMLLHGDGTNGAQNNTFLDSSTNNFTITRNGNTTQGTFTPYGVNWSNYFDGSGDYLTIADNAALELSTSSFTMEWWSYPTTFASNQFQLSKCATSASTEGFLTYINTSGVLKFNANSVSAWDIANDQGTLALNLNAWNHCAISRNGSSWRMWVNGASSVTITSALGVQNTTTAYSIGGAANGSAPFLGYMSNTRIVIGSYVYDPASSTLTIPTAPLTAITNTQLLTCQSNRFLDNSSNAFTITKNGDTSVQRFSPFSPTTAYSTSVIGGSAYFDGTGDYLTELTATTALNLSSGDWSISFWVYKTAASNGGIVNLYNSAGNTSGLSIWVGSNGAVHVDNGITGAINAGNTGINTWAYVEVIRSSGTTTCYVNGTSVGTTTQTPNASQYASIGTAADGTLSNQGYITDLRIVKGTALSSSVPTAPLTAVTNTSLLLSYTNAGILDNAMMNDLETVGNAQISTSVKKYGTGSIALDGTGDYLRGPNSPLFAFGTGNFTFEAWVYFADSGATNRAFFDTGVNSNTGRLLIRQGSDTGGASNVVNAYVTGTTVSSPTISFNTWTHVAVVRNSGTVTIYINGTGGTGVSASGDLSQTGCLIGAFYDQLTWNFTGYIDDLRITKGVARYTANFTAPTTAFADKG